MDCIHPMQKIADRLISAYVYGETNKDSRKDLSNFHVGVLWIGATVVGYCLVRALGSLFVEMPYLEIREEFRGHSLSRHLLGSLESSLLRVGVQHILMPAILTRTTSTAAKVSRPQLYSIHRSSLVCHLPLVLLALCSHVYWNLIFPRCSLIISSRFMDTSEIFMTGNVKVEFQMLVSMCCSHTVGQ